MSQHICVVGTVATDPKLVQIGSGVRLCSFRLGSSERRYDRSREEWIDGATNWFTVNVFHQLGEHAASSLAKGQRVIVKGKLKIRNWERDGAKGTAVELEADAVGHDLRWGISQFTKSSTQRMSEEREPDQTSTQQPAHGEASQGEASQGEASQGEASQGEASRGDARWEPPLADAQAGEALREVPTPF